MLQTVVDAIETKILENAEKSAEEVKIEVVFNETDDSSPENRRKSIIRTPNSTPRTRNKLGFKELLEVVEFDKDNSPSVLIQSPLTLFTSDQESVLRNRNNPRRMRKMASETMIRTSGTVKVRDSLVGLRPCFDEIKRDQAILNSPTLPSFGLGTFDFSAEMDESLDSDMDSAFSELFNLPDLPRKRRSLDAALTMSQSEDKEEGSPTKKSAPSHDETKTTVTTSISVTVVATEASSCQQIELLELISEKQVVEIDESEDNINRRKSSQQSAAPRVLTDISNSPIASQEPLSPASGSKYLQLLQDQCFSTPPTFADQSFEEFDDSFEMYAPEADEAQDTNNEQNEEINGMFEDTIMKAPLILSDNLSPREFSVSSNETKDHENQPGADVPYSPTKSRTEPRVIPERYFLDNRTPVIIEVARSFSELLGSHCGGMLPVKQTTII